MNEHKPDTLPTPVVETPADAAKAAIGVKTFRKKLTPEEIAALQSAVGPLGKVTEALRLRLTEVIENARRTNRGDGSNVETSIDALLKATNR